MFLRWVLKSDISPNCDWSFLLKYRKFHMASAKVGNLLPMKDLNASKVFFKFFYLLYLVISDARLGYMQFKNNLGHAKKPGQFSVHRLVLFCREGRCLFRNSFFIRNHRISVPTSFTASLCVGVKPSNSSGFLSFHILTQLLKIPLSIFNSLAIWVIGRPVWSTN